MTMMSAPAWQAARARSGVRMPPPANSGTEVSDDTDAIMPSLTGILAPRLWGAGGVVTRSPHFISGLARPGATIRVYRDGSVMAEVPADANGLFSTRLDLVAGVEHSIHVTQVLGGSPANDAGLRAGDELISYNGERVFNVMELRNGTMQGQPGECSNTMPTAG